MAYFVKARVLEQPSWRESFFFFNFLFFFTLAAAATADEPNAFFLFLFFLWLPHNFLWGYIVIWELYPRDLMYKVHFGSNVTLVEALQGEITAEMEVVSFIVGPLQESPCHLYLFENIHLGTLPVTSEPLVFFYFEVLQFKVSLILEDLSKAFMELTFGVHLANIEVLVKSP